MAVKGRFSLDTNILVYAVDRDSGERHELARELIGRAAQRDCVLTVQALAEFFHATTRKNLLEPARASAFVRDWLDGFHVTSADDTALTDAMDAVSRSIGYRSGTRCSGPRHGRSAVPRSSAKTCRTAGA